LSDTFSFPSSWRWLDRPPLHLESGLFGHVVVVLYWRLGCVHSRAALREVVAATAGMSGQPVAVIAVHVATCEAENDESRLRMELSQLAGPVTAAIQPERDSLDSLPTVVLVNGAGVVKTRAVGVPRRGALQAAIDMLLAEERAAGRTVTVPFVPVTMRHSWDWAPAAVASDGDVFWVASPLQRRVFALNDDGEVTMVVGSGDEGCVDGPADEASFSQPVSLCVHDEFIVVADVQTHTLRAIDRHSGEVTTWCGTGVLGADDVGGAYGLDQALSSPAGLISRDGGLYVCMSGTNQIWQVDPMTGSAMAWLGRDFGGAEFQEPVAILSCDDSLWVVEAQGAALSVVDLAHVFKQSVSRSFLRPVDVAAHGDFIYVADSWQKAVIKVKVDDGSCETVFGADHGLIDPSGLAMDGNKLLIADAGADAIFRHDFDDPREGLVPVDVTGLPAQNSPQMVDVALLVEPLSMREFSDVTLHIEIAGHDDGAEAVVDVVDEAVPVLACARREEVSLAAGRVSVLLPIADSGDGVLRIRVMISGDVLSYLLPVQVVADGQLEGVLVAST
jgi:hypothetical protein